MGGYGGNNSDGMCSAIHWGKNPSVHIKHPFYFSISQMEQLFRHRTLGDTSGFHLKNAINDKAEM